MEEAAVLESVEHGAGFGIRALARIIDMGMGYVLGFTAGIIGGVVLVVLESGGMISPGWEYRIGETTAITFMLSLFGAFCYHVLCEGMHGSTLGKIICRIQVISQDGGHGTVGGAFIRSLAWYVDGLFFGLVGYSSMEKSPLRQRFGDVWGKTMVVRTSQLPGTSRRSMGRFCLALFLGMNCWMLILVMSLVIQGS